MAHEKLRGLIEQVTKDLAPSCLEILSVDEEVLRLRVVSEKFSGISLVKRFDLLGELFERRGLEIAKKYTLIFEAWTKAEFDRLDLDQGSKSGSDSEGQEPRAARQPEL